MALWLQWQPASSPQSRLPLIGKDDQINKRKFLPSFGFRLEFLTILVLQEGLILIIVLLLFH